MSDGVKIPVLLDLTDLWILIVGGGMGAETKLRALAEMGPRIRLVAPDVSGSVRDLLTACREVDLRERPFEPDDLLDVNLVYCMTDSAAVNTRVAGLCRASGIWHNVAHERGPGSFSSPAVWRGKGIIAAFHSASGEPQRAVRARDEYRQSQGAR